MKFNSFKIVLIYPIIVFILSQIQVTQSLANTKNSSENLENCYLRLAYAFENETDISQVSQSDLEKTFPQFIKFVSYSFPDTLEGDPTEASKFGSKVIDIIKNKCGTYNPAVAQKLMNQSYVNTLLDVEYNQANNTTELIKDIKIANNYTETGYHILSMINTANVSIEKLIPFYDYLALTSSVLEKIDFFSKSWPKVTKEEITSCQSYYSSGAALNQNCDPNIAIQNLLNLFPEKTLSLLDSDYQKMAIVHLALKLSLFGDVDNDKNEVGCFNSVCKALMNKLSQYLEKNPGAISPQLKYITSESKTLRIIKLKQTNLKQIQSKNITQLLSNAKLLQCSTTETIKHAKYTIDKEADTIFIEQDKCLNEIKIKTQVEKSGYKINVLIKNSEAQMIFNQNLTFNNFKELQQFFNQQ